MDAFEAAFKQTRLVARYPGRAGGRQTRRQQPPRLWLPRRLVRLGHRSHRQIVGELVLRGHSCARGGRHREMARPNPSAAKYGLRFGSASSTNPPAPPRARSSIAAWRRPTSLGFATKASFEARSKGQPGNVPSRQPNAWAMNSTSPARTSRCTRRHSRLPSPVTNTGVAPYYYNWPVELGALDARGSLTQTWTTDWQLTGIPTGESVGPSGISKPPLASLKPDPINCYYACRTPCRRISAEVRTPISGRTPARLADAGHLER
jgi:hypothetical protein